MSACEDYALMLHGLFDGELDAANAMRTEAHLRECQKCASVYEDLRGLGDALRQADLSYSSPPNLFARVRAALEREVGGRGWRMTMNWPNLGLPAAMAAAAACAVFLVAVPRGGVDLADQVVAGHVRSLMANHLMDVATSDRHAVKPWFAGRIDFSPPVYDLAAQGFPLAGGRVDFIDHHPVAAIIYRHGAHVINLFLWPTRAGEERAEPISSLRDGYTVRHWRKNGMSCWAVSDVTADELEQFERVIKAATPL